MSSEKTSNRMQITVALIGLVGVLGAALIVNWRSIFLESGHETPLHKKAVSDIQEEPPAPNEVSWYDSSTGLHWQEPPANRRAWESANDYCSTLILGGKSDWRLPTIDELRSIVVNCPRHERDGACGIHNDCATSSCFEGCNEYCPEGGGPTDGCYWKSPLTGGCTFYWSSTAHGNEPNLAWGIEFPIGGVTCPEKKHQNLIRCVRG